MAEWTPWVPNEQSRRPAPGSIYLRKGGVLVLGRENMERLGRPAYVNLLTNGAPHKFGVRPAPGRPGGGYGTGASGAPGGIAIKGFLRARGKDSAFIENLPHEWEGDVLVIDISSLPDLAEGGEG